MGKHIWEWDKVSEKPMRVVCVKCGRRETLDRVLNEIGCGGCLVEGKQERLFDDRSGKSVGAEA